MESPQNQATNDSGEEVDLEGYVQVKYNSLLTENESSSPLGKPTQTVDNIDAEEQPTTSYSDAIKDPVAVPISSPEIVPVESVTPRGADSCYEFVENSQMQVWVTSAKQAEEVSKLGVTVKFTSYMVKCQTVLSSYSFNDRTVWRRYKDFDAFRQLLRIKYPGYFCPPLPHKHYLNSIRAKEDFIQNRRLDFEKFLRRVVSNAAFVESNETKIFLGSPEELTHTDEWMRLLQYYNIRKPGASLDESGLAGAKAFIKKDLRNTFRKVGNSLKRDASKNTKISASDEANLKQITAQIKKYQFELGTCCSKSKAMMTALDGVTAETQQMGKIFVNFARFEERSVHQCGQYTETGRSAALCAGKLQKTGYTTLRAHNMHQKSIMNLSSELSALEDQLLLIPCALDGLGDREALVERIRDSESVLEETRQRMGDVTRDAAKKVGGKATYSSKSAQLSRDISTMVEDLGNLYIEHEQIKRINMQEVESLSRQRRIDLHAMIVNLAATQKEFHEGLAEAWTLLGAQLSDVSPMR